MVRAEAVSTNVSLKGIAESKPTQKALNHALILMENPGGPERWGAPLVRRESHGNFCT